MSTASPSPLVSCLCITHRRVPMLRRAVHAFLAQTGPARELLVLHEDVDTDTRDYVAALAHPSVRTLVVPAAPHLTLGEKRQLAVEAARGELVATWDDDDWSAPTRLAEQTQALLAGPVPVVVLEQVIAYDSLLGRAWLTQRRAWECTMVARRDVLPRYEAGERGTDRISMEWLHARRLVGALQRVPLYIYLYHGGNVGSRVHFKRNVFAPGQALSAAFSARIARVLADPGEPAPTTEELARAIAQPT